MRRARSGESGYSLVEVLVTITIVGISAAVIVGGMGVAIVGSDHHRKQAVGQASIRNFAEAVKAAAYDPVCDTAKASYSQVYRPSPPTRTAAATIGSNATSHVAPSIKPALVYSRLLAFYTLAGGSPLTPPAGTTQHWHEVSAAVDETNRVRASLVDRELAASGATGALTATSAETDSIAQAVLLASATGSAHSIVPRGYSPAVTGTGGNTLTFATPAGTVAGDAMIAQVAVRGGAATTVSPPVGWLLVNARDNGLAVKSLIYERTATSSTTETYTWTFGSSPEAAGGLISYGGASTSSTAFVDNVQFWNGTTFVNWSTGDPCPFEGLQRVFVRVESPDRRSVEEIQVVKRQP